ncbi:MAG: hypothetical protein CSB55_00505 [Candidatus Cloacimonadota bacterium]|nr:MAG: hypothetical protein CSB55_00505 [Candidatus Cloacimonadota bacterium]
MFSTVLIVYFSGDVLARRSGQKRQPENFIEPSQILLDDEILYDDKIGCYFLQRDKNTVYFYA